GLSIAPGPPAAVTAEWPGPGFAYPGLRPWGPQRWQSLVPAGLSIAPGPPSAVTAEWPGPGFGFAAATAVSVAAARKWLLSCPGAFSKPEWNCCGGQSSVSHSRTVFVRQRSS